MNEEKLPKISEEMREKLKSQFPAIAYKSIDTKSYLGSLKPQYIIERLNDVFGIGRWEIIHEVAERFVDYVLVKGTIKIYDYDVHVPWYYGGHKLEGKNTEPADGYKSAVTDCFSKCASFLEIGNDLFKGCLKFDDGVITFTPDLEPLKSGENKANHIKKNQGWSKGSEDSSNSFKKNTQEKSGLPSWLISKVSEMGSEEIKKYGENLAKSEKYARITESSEYKSFIAKEIARAIKEGR